MGVDWNDGTAFATHYDPPYTRAGRQLYYRRDLPGFTWEEKIRDYLLATIMSTATTADKIFDFGGAYGWLMEVFEDIGYTDCWPVDPSDYIETNSGTESVNSNGIIKTNVHSAISQVRKDLRDASGSDKADWIITSSMLESMDRTPQDEVVATLNFCEGRRQNPQQSRATIIHIVQCVQVHDEFPSEPDKDIDPAFLQYTLAEWSAIRPEHSWLDVGGDNLKHHLGTG